MIPEAQPLRLPGQRRRRDDRRLGLRLLAFVEPREVAEQHVGDDEPEQRVAEKLHRLVVGDAPAHVLVRPRRVGHGVFEQAAIAEPVADRLLQRLELVAQAHDLPVLQLGAVGVDDPLCLLGVGRVHRDSDVAQPVDRQREDRVRNVRRRDDRHHVVGFEQAADDLRLDVGMRAEDDDEIGHSVKSRRPFNTPQDTAGILFRDLRELGGLRS